MAERGRDYQEFEWQGRRIFVAIGPHEVKQDGVKHIIVVHNDGRAELLTSWEVKTVPDLVDLVVRSIRSEQQ